MKCRHVHLIILLLAAAHAYATTVNVGLGTANLFAVLGGTTITNTGSSTVNGNLGLWSGTSITGFPPGTVNGAIDATNAAAMQAQMDLTNAYNVAACQPCGGVLTGQNLGGKTLTPGVYCFASSAQLTGTLNLNFQGDPTAVFIFQIGSTLTTASGSSVVFSNGGDGGNVFWQVGSSATLGTATAFAGNILALSSITMDTGANINCGRALALNGAVTLDTNTVSLCDASVDAPEPGTAALLGLGLFGLAGYRQQSRKHFSCGSQEDLF